MARSPFVDRLMREVGVRVEKAVIDLISNSPAPSKTPPSKAKSPASPRTTAIRKQDKLNRFATEKMRVAGGKVETYTPKPPAQDVEKVIEAVAAEEERARKKAFLANLKPGQQMPDGSIFVGRYSPKDRQGNSLCREFNVFAAKEDLPAGRQMYCHTVQHLAKLRNWNGYNGASYENDTQLYEALRKGTYAGQWIIPTKEILHGRDMQDALTMPDNIHTHKDSIFGDLLEQPGFIDSYWSCTEDPDNSKKVFKTTFHSRSMYTENKAVSKLRCRPVRLEPVP